MCEGKWEEMAAHLRPGVVQGYAVGPEILLRKFQPKGNRWLGGDLRSPQTAERSALEIRWVRR